MKRLLLAGSVLTLALVPGLANAAIDDTALVSRAGGVAGEAANGDSGTYPAISGDGRFVAFVSGADNLSSADNDSVQNVFLRDMLAQTTTLISRATGPGGAGADADSFTPSLSSDGRYVAFASPATNLSDQDADLTRDIFVRDTLMDTTTLVSRADISVGDVAAAGDSSNPSISDSGNQIAFDSAADNLSPDDTDGTRDVFVRDVSAGTTTLVSRANGIGSNPNAPGDSNSSRPSISANGQRIAFESEADNLSADDNDAVRNVYVREPRFQFTQHVSRTTATGFVSEPADGDSFGAALSGDGSVVAFTSVARNLSAVNPPSNATQVFKRMITAEETILVSRAAGADGAPANRSSIRARPSADGRYIAFASKGDNLSDQDGPLTDVFVRDTVENRTALVSRATGASGAAGSGNSLSPSISGSGLLVVFCSDADNLSAEDNDAYTNLFARELAPGLPAPVVLPDLGNNDHSGHSGTDHSAADHAAAGHSADHSTGAGHSHAPTGNVKLSGGILFADKKQDIDRLFVYVTIHEHGKIALEGTIRLSGRAARILHFRTVKRTLAPHVLRKMRLKLSRQSLRAVKRALRHRKLNARIKLTAVEDSGQRQVARRTIRLKP